VQKRTELVTQLVREGLLPSDQLRRLHDFRWDSEAILAVLTRDDAVRILRRHLGAELTADEVVEWANQIEAREDIGFEHGYEDALEELIYELANPTLHPEPTTEAAKRWLSTLA
jgi:cobyrinic acid a,c-diamide synthase